MNIGYLDRLAFRRKTFKTTATNKGIQILTLTPFHEYQIVKGQAVEKENLTIEPPIKNTQPISKDTQKNFKSTFMKAT